MAHRFSPSLRQDQGSATAEFAMVASLLVLLVIAIIQIAGMVHVRNTLIDAASTGARFGALDDRTAEDGVERARSLIASSVADRYAQDISYTYRTEENGEVLQITVEAQYPVLVLLAGTGSLEATGSAYVYE